MKLAILAAGLLSSAAMAQTSGSTPINPACTSYFQCEAECYSSSKHNQILVSEGMTKVEAYQSLQQQCWAYDSAGVLRQEGTMYSATMTSACKQGTN
jgi:hypothetical protein